MDESEFQEQRQAKTAEIRRTGKTWQWPDTVQHPEWTRAHVLVLVAVAVTVAGILALVLEVFC
jgi:hypothetical protein